MGFIHQREVAFEWALTSVLPHDFKLRIICIWRQPKNSLPLSEKKERLSPKIQKKLDCDRNPLSPFWLTSRVNDLLDVINFSSTNDGFELASNIPLVL